MWDYKKQWPRRRGCSWAALPPKELLSWDRWDMGVCGQYFPGWQQCQGPKRGTNLMCSRDKKKVNAPILSLSLRQVCKYLPGFCAFTTALRRTRPGWPAGPGGWNTCGAEPAKPNPEEPTPLWSAHPREGIVFILSQGLGLPSWPSG